MNLRNCTEEQLARLYEEYRVFPHTSDFVDEIIAELARRDAESDDD